MDGTDGMRSVARILIPFILLVAGVAALIYAATARSLPVLAEVMVEKEQIILERPPEALWRGPSGRGGRPMPPPPPRPRKVKVEVVEEQEQQFIEPRVIREVTVGGIARLENGRLKLTYGPGKSGPALCPT